MPVNGITRSTLVLLALATCTLLGACSGGPKDVAPADTQVIRDEEQSILARRASIEGARRDFEAGQSDEAIREAVKSVAWSRSARQDLRLEALEALFADEANLEDTRNMLRLMIPTESAWSEWEVLRYLGAQADARGWTDLAPAFVASLSRVRPLAPDLERPEYETLSKLVGERNIPDLVFDVFAGLVENAVTRERDRLDAWSLLQRLDPDGVRTGERLRTLTIERDDDTLLMALKRGADELGVVAATGEELAWLNRLSQEEHRTFWSTASGVVAVLRGNQQQGLALRHLAALVWASRHRPGWLATTRPELIAHIEGRLDGRVTNLRHGASTSGQRELFRYTKDGLRWADALVVAVTLEALDDVGLASEVFRQADLDHNDRSTEHGGVITGDDSAPVFYATHYPPRPAQRYGDNRFVASPEMITNSDDALLHYHFHASSLKHREYAGPSAGDTEYAALYRRGAVVFTFIDGDTLGVDYYQPDGVTVDLGEIARP